MPISSTVDVGRGLGNPVGVPVGVPAAGKRREPAGDAGEPAGDGAGGGVDEGPAADGDANSSRRANLRRIDGMREDNNGTGSTVADGTGGGGRISSSSTMPPAGAPRARHAVSYDATNGTKLTAQLDVADNPGWYMTTAQRDRTPRRNNASRKVLYVAQCKRVANHLCSQFGGTVVRRHVRRLTRALHDTRHTTNTGSTKQRLRSA